MIAWLPWAVATGVALATASCATSSGSSGPSGSVTDGDRREASPTDRARLLVEAANGALREGDATGALQFLAQAESLDAKLPELFHSRAIAFHAKQRPEEALASVKRALELRPGYVDASITLGKILIDLRRYEEAAPPLTAAANDPLNRDAYKAFTNLGILHYRQAHWREAAVEFDRAIRESKSQACIAHYYRGHIYLQDAQFEDAVKEYGQATQRTCAGFGDAHLALGIAYERSQRYQDARKKFLDIRQNFPNTKLAEQAMQRLRYLP